MHAGGRSLSLPALCRLARDADEFHPALPPAWHGNGSDGVAEKLVGSNPVTSGDEFPKQGPTLATGMLLSAPSVAASTTNAAPATPAGAFGSNQQNGEKSDLMPDIERRVRCLCQEDGGGRQIEAGAIEIEGITVGTTSPTTLLSQPKFSSLVMSRGSTVSDEVVATQISSSSQIYLTSFNRLNRTCERPSSARSQ